MWTKTYSNTDMHYDHDAVSHMAPFLDAHVATGSQVPLYAMTDHLEEIGHPAARIIRGALDHGEILERGNREYRADKTGWLRGKGASEYKLGPHLETVPHPTFGGGTHSVFLRHGPHYWHFQAQHSQEHLDYLHSTGMPG